MSRIFNVAVVGGGIGRAHIAEGYAALPGQYRVLAMCELDAARLQSLGRDFAIPRLTASLDEVLAMPDIDIVDICTPPQMHLAHCLSALAAGKHVICEKPLVGSLADADTLIAAQAEAAGVLMPIFQYRFGNGLQKARHIIRAGLAGKPYLATVETAWKRDAAYYAVPWRGKFATELGGALLGHAIHAHDLLTYLMGPVKSVFARTATLVNNIEVEDTAAASLELASGALATLSVTLGSAREISRLRLCFEHVTFQSALSPYAPGDDPWQIIPASADAARAIDAALADWNFIASRFAGQLNAFHASICAGAPPPVTLGEARQSLELVTALYHAAETGLPVSLPLGAEHPKYRSWQPAA